MRRISLILITSLLIAFGTFQTAAGVELIVNGGFETGSFGTSWVHGAYRGATSDPSFADHVVILDLPYEGNYSALLGFKYTAQVTNTYAFAYQEVTLPANLSAAVLNFKVRMLGYDSDPYDPFWADIRDTSNNTLQNILTHSFTEWNDKFKDSGWLSDDNQNPEGFDVSGFAGQTIRVYFLQSNLFDNLYETWTYVDNVSLVYRMWTDLAVDGNGDDIFGAIGSGAGGLSARSAVAGDTLYYQVVVENEGTVADTYQLGVSPPPGFDVAIDGGGGYQSFPLTTPSMPTGATAAYTVRVVVPLASPGGVFDVIVDAVSTSIGTRFDSATLRANVVTAIFGTDVVVDGNGVGVLGDNGTGGFGLKEAPWDSTLTYSVDVFNTGNGSTTYDIDFWNDPGATVSIWYGGVQYSAPFTTAVIAPGGSAAMTLEMTGPTPIPGGDYATIVRAVATADTIRKDTIRAIMRLRAPRVDLIIATSGNGIYDDTYSGLGGASSNAGEPGVVVNFPVTLQNESVLDDAFTLDWVAPAAGWTAVIAISGVDQAFPAVTPAVPSHSQAEYTLRVTIPGGAVYGTYQSILNAESGIDNRISESVSAIVSVASPSEIDMTIDGDGTDVYGPISTGLGGSSVQTAAPGDTVTFSIGIENILGTDSFESFWTTPPGWQVTLGGNPSPVSGIPAGTYALQAIVPATSLGGTFDIILDARKTDKPFFMDSVTGRVVVTPPAVVDALVDGNGDEIFGAVGTGTGGSSSQTTSAPAAPNFTIEIQNQGATTDQYDVVWNSFPGWSANLDGFPSPYTTSPIPAGGSHIYTFSVDVPGGAIVGMYDFVVDIVSTSDSTSFESVTATVNVVGPPRADLVIDGNGTGVFGPMASGQGGASVRSAAPGTLYAAILRVRNAGSFPDSFRVNWQLPVGWPAGSVIVDDGITAFPSDFWTAVIAAGNFIDYAVTVSVPVTASGSHQTIFNSWSSLPPNATESVSLTTETRAIVRGIVFDDRDHNGVFSGGDIGIGGVTVVEQTSGLTAITTADGRYRINIASGANVVVEERNLSGYISITADTLGPFTVVAGDTITADYADVPPLTVTPGNVRTGLAGSYVDFPHLLQAGTAGPVNITASAGAGIVTMLLFDENGNGVFDGNDRPLTAADTDLDPVGGPAGLAFLIRVFVPAQTPAGITLKVDLSADQLISGTALHSIAGAADAVVVVGSAFGRLALSKDVDLGSAAPGDVITYTIDFFNAGSDSIQNVILLDPVSPWLDLEPGSYGVGQDLEWIPPGGPAVYLTFAPGDADECEYSSSERLIRIITSKNSPFFIPSGGRGSLSYRARVR